MNKCPTLLLLCVCLFFWVFNVSKLTPVFMYISLKRMQNVHIHIGANHKIKLLGTPLFLSPEIIHFCFGSVSVCCKTICKYLSFLLKLMALSSPGGTWGCTWRYTEVSTGSYLLNWIYLATLSSPRIVWFPTGNVCLWKLQWGNSFFTSVQENEFNIVWRWDSSPGGSTKHLMSLGANQKNSRGCIPIPTPTLVP